MLKVPVGSIVFPGDTVAEISVEEGESGIVKDQVQGKREEESDDKKKSKKPIQIGHGLLQQQNEVMSTKAGILQHKKGKTYWVDSNQRRYIPSVNDYVVGTIADRFSEGYFVDIGAHKIAKLDMLAFPGATKRNRPELKIGTLVYCRVILATRDMTPEVACMNAQGKADGLGPLTGGNMVKISLSFARRLMSDSCTVLIELGKYIPFEAAVGLNGRVWVDAPDIKSAMLVGNAITNSEYLSAANIEKMVALIQKRLSSAKRR